jgi:glycolate oxidase iron-sulfur subunit
METQLAAFIRDTPEGREADAILRACVHCGFCTATCPTYQLLGDELDGPRGRIYLIKQVLEGATPTEKTQLHLDRCLTCLSCETTCPSGVRYGHLVDIGRKIVDRQVPRPPLDAARRTALRRGLLSKPLFGAALAAGRLARAFLPGPLARRIPETRPAGEWPAPRHSRRMLIAEGCVQPSIAPNIDAAMARVLDRLGITPVRAQYGECCGALPHHLGEQEEALALVRRNVDAWWPHLDRDCEAVIVTASGCGVMVRDYGYLLKHDPNYAERARRVAELARDPVEVVAQEWTRIAPQVAMDLGAVKVAFHAPCTLQHGLRLRGQVEDILQALGYSLTPVADPHLCCGSAGTYSILQPELATRLRENKLVALEAGHPKIIATANIGCLTHLSAGTRRPVRHWIELLDERMLNAGRPL